MLRSVSSPLSACDFIRQRLVVWVHPDGQDSELRCAHIILLLTTSYKSNLYSGFGPWQNLRAAATGKVSLTTVVVERNKPVLMIHWGRKPTLLDVPGASPCLVSSPCVVLQKIGRNGIPLNTFRSQSGKASIPDQPRGNIANCFHIPASPCQVEG